MSAEHRTCWVLVCDTCRTDLEDPDNDYVPHFDTLDAATDYARMVGWQLDTDGRIVCDRCTATAACTVRRARLQPVVALRLPGAHPRPRALRLRPAPHLHALRPHRNHHPRRAADHRRTTRSLTATVTPGPARQASVSGGVW